MELNKSMRSLLEKHSVNMTDCIPENTYPIWSKTDVAGREYFGKAFVIFKVRMGYNGISRQFATAFDWLFGCIPLVLYVIFLAK